MPAEPKDAIGRFKATRDAVRRLHDVQLAIMHEGEDWRPSSPRAKAGIADPTASRAIYRADELRVVLDSLRAEERELIGFIGTTLRLIQAIRDGLGARYGDILEWLYIDCLTWPEIRELHGVSKSAGSEWRTIACDWVDSVGTKRLLRGEMEL